jgi:hypothetical protein
MTLLPPVSTDGGYRSEVSILGAHETSVADVLIFSNSPLKRAAIHYEFAGVSSKRLIALVRAPSTMLRMAPLPRFAWEDSPPRRSAVAILPCREAAGEQL